MKVLIRFKTTKNCIGIVNASPGAELKHRQSMAICCHMGWFKVLNFLGLYNKLRCRGKKPDLLVDWGPVILCVRCLKLTY